MKTNNQKLGLTIIELLLVIAVILVLSATTIGYYRGKIIEVSLESTTKTFISNIKSAKQRAMVGDKGSDWGVRVVVQDVNNSGSFELYSLKPSLNTKEVVDKNNLSPGLSWVDPSSGEREIVFKAITGEASSTSFTLGYGNTKYKINISDNGEVVQSRI